MLPRPASSKPPPPPNYKLRPWLEPTGKIPFVFGGQDTSRLLPERVSYHMSRSQGDRMGVVCGRCGRRATLLVMMTSLVGTYLYIWRLIA